jgi:hypothetical protein
LAPRENFRGIKGTVSRDFLSTTLAANFPTISAGVVETGGKFATGINDTSGQEWEQYQTASNLK